MAGKGKELRAKVKELTESLEKEESANKLNTAEFQVRSWISKEPCQSGRVPGGDVMQASYTLSCTSCLACLVCVQHKTGRSNAQSAAWDVLRS